MVLGAGLPVRCGTGWGAVVAAGHGEGSVVREEFLSRESSGKVLGFPKEQDPTALLLPPSQHKYKRRLGS